MRCKNCNKESVGNFCPDCGQKLNIKPISVGALVDDVVQAVNLERGFFYTFKELSTRPGKAIAEYIGGKRVVHMSPMRYLVFMVAIGALVSLFFKLEPFVSTGSEDSETLLYYKEIEVMVKEYYSLISFITIPILAFFSWLLFKKNNGNYAHHLVLNAYITAHNNVLFLISAPFFIQPIESIYEFGSYLFIVTSIIYSIWAYLQFFEPKRKLIAIGKVALVNILFGLVTQFFAVLIIGVLR